jgi:hypothetical protein
MMNVKQWVEDNMFRVILFGIVVLSELILLGRDGLIGGLSNVGNVLAVILTVFSLFGYSTNFKSDLSRIQKVMVSLLSTVGLGGAALTFFKWQAFIQDKIGLLEDILLYVPLVLIFIISVISLLLKKKEA